MAGATDGVRAVALCAALAAVAGVARGDAAKTRPAPPSAATLAEYRKHLRAGRKLGDAKRWGEAVVELEAALEAIPLDGRALSELGWAAFAAGDYDRARAATTAAVRVAGDFRVKAASLYNLGRIAEAKGDRAGAVRAYAASLGLRPGNKIVADALAAAQKAAPAAAAADGPPCPDDEEKLGPVCGCLVRAVGAEEGRSDCTVEESGLPRPFWLATIKVPAEHEEYNYLVAKGDLGYRVVAELDTVYNPGAMGISEEWELGGASIDEVGGHRVLRVHEHHQHMDNDRGINETESSDDDDVTVCVVGADQTPTRCPLRLTQRHAYVREVMFPDDKDDTEKHAGLPRKEGFQLAVDLDPSGRAVVKLTTGAADERARAVLGPHQLW
jgi:hypothetical protein